MTFLSALEGEGRKKEGTRARERRERPPADEQWFEQNLGVWAGPVAAGPELVAEFNALVAPLETADGRVLNGPGRQTCLRAFRENPDGFRRLVAIALEKGRPGSKRGLLIHMCRLGDHRLDDSHTRADVREEGAA